MADAVDGHFDGTWFTNDDQWLEAHAVMVVEQNLIHLHGVRLKMELTIGDLHRVDSLHRGRPGVRHQEDALTLILLSIHGALDMALSVIGLLTAQ